MGFLTGISDHGLLTGLADDDHTQYVLRNILTTDGDLFSRAAGAISRIADVAIGSYLASGGVGVVPAWATLNQAAVADLTTASSPTFAALTTTALAALTTAAESWVGPSSTTGVYFKGGNAGIGAAPTDMKLYVYNATANTQLWVRSGSSTSISALVAINDASTSYNQFITFGSAYVGTRKGVTAAGLNEFSAEGNLWIGTQSDSTLYLGTNSLVRGVIDNSGNVGIGTETPTISGTGKLHMAADTFRLATARTPATAGAAGNAGDICWDASFIYVCTATNAWERVGIATW